MVSELDSQVKILGSNPAAGSEVFFFLESSYSSLPGDGQFYNERLCPEIGSTLKKLWALNV